MYKRILGLSIVLLSGCTTLASDDDFSDAIKETSRKLNYISIEAKSINPIENESVGANALRNTSQVTANYPTSNKTIPESYMAVELSYFKANYEYSSVTINGKKRDISAYSPSTETCSEHCTETQYFTFSIDNQEIKQSAKSGLTYVVSTTNNMSQLSFSIPSGYFQAIINEKEANSTVEKIKEPAASLVAITEQSKPVEMTKYWFDEASPVEQEQFTEWAFANRKAVSSKLAISSKSLEMLRYWYEKAPSEDKAQILTWLLNK